MKLFGETAPDGTDGYVPGAWDEVMHAYIHGRISKEAYRVLQAKVFEKSHPAGMIDRPNE